MEDELDKLNKDLKEEERRIDGLDAESKRLTDETNRLRNRCKLLEEVVFSCSLQFKYLFIA